MRFRTKGFILVVFIFAFAITIASAWSDEAIVKCLIKEKGDNFILVKISETGIFKAGSSQTFYLHPKTKITMAESESPLVFDSLLVGDIIQITPGETEKIKGGKIKYIVDKVVVLPSRRSGKHKKRLKFRK